MRKIAMVMIALMFAVVAGTSEVYQFDYVVTTDIDYIVIKNQSQVDLHVRFCAGSCCAIASIPSGKTEKIKIGIEEKVSAVFIPMKFECRDINGISIPVTWLMDSSHDDINITLLPDEGWHF